MPQFNEETIKKLLSILGGVKQREDKYKNNLNIYTEKNPNESSKKKYILTLINKTSLTQVFKKDEFIITERFSNYNEFFPLSNNEILSILEYYDILKLNIEILHYKLVNIQAFTDGQNLTLKIPSDLAIKLRKENLRFNALFTLLHEISHILGNAFPTNECELEADRFATQELLKWERIIDLKE